MNWVPVVSTVFTSVAYDEGTRQLYLTFHSGKTYRYFEFPAHQWVETEWPAEPPFAHGPKTIMVAYFKALPQF